MPVTLAVAIGLVSGYLVLGDLAVFSAVSEIKAEASHLGAANAAAEEEITRHSSTPEKIASADKIFQGDPSLCCPCLPSPAGSKMALPGWSTRRDAFICAPRSPQGFSWPGAMVVSSVPLDKKFLGKIASTIGSAHILFARHRIRWDGKSLENAISDAQSASGLPASRRISAGIVSEPVMALDLEFHFAGLIPSPTGRMVHCERDYFGVTTRFSTVYSYLTSSMGIGSTFRCLLISLAIAFAIVVLIALLIGVGLTRKITYSVANLYRATQYIQPRRLHAPDRRTGKRPACRAAAFLQLNDRKSGKADR